MEARQCINIMTPPASGGSISFQFQTYNANPNITIVATVTGVDATNSEEDLAANIAYQLGTIQIQNQVDFEGNVDLVTNPPPDANFYLSRTDHVINVFSQSQFSVKVTANNTGADVEITPDPILVKLSDAKAFGPSVGNNWVDSSTGIALTNSQIITALRLSSSYLVSVLRNRIVKSMYILQILGNWTISVQTQKKPIIRVFNPLLRRPDVPTFLDLSSQLVDPLSVYDVQDDEGWIAYRYAQEVFNALEPFDKDNTWRLAYEAGYHNIPDAIKFAIIRLAYIQQRFSNVKSLKGGTSEIVYGTTNSDVQILFRVLGDYAL